MVEEKYISAEEARDGQGRAARACACARDPPSIAPYFLEEVRKYLEREYGSQRIYQGGLRVYTTLDPATAARRPTGAVRTGLRAPGPPRRAASCRPTRRILQGRRASPSAIHLDEWDRPLRGGRRGARRGARLGPRARRSSRSASTARAWGRRTSPGRGAASVAEVLPRGRGGAASCIQSPRARRAARKDAKVALRAGAEGARARSSPSTSRRARCGPWWAATTSSGASSTAPPRPCARWARPSSRSSTRRPSSAPGYTPATIIVDSPISFPDNGGGVVVAAQLRLHVLGPDPGAPRHRAEPEHPRHQDAAGGGHQDRASSTRTSSA